jgi:hypothetical protein
VLAEQLLDSRLDFPHPQRSAGLLDNACHGAENRTLPSTKRTTRERRSSGPPSQLLVELHQPREFNPESRVQECSG